MENRDMALGGIFIAILVLFLLGVGVLFPPGEEPPGGGDTEPGIPCTNDGDCPPGMVCINGYCDYPPDECDDGFDCPSGVCINGVCEDECDDDSDCPPGQTCESGECVDDDSCTDDFDCSDGEVCKEGTCVDPCEEVDCPDGDICVEGDCVDPCDTIECPEGEICVGGGCVEEPPDDDEECADHFDCPTGYCVGGECVDCLGDEDCPDGFCVDGECVDCLGDEDCPDGYLCIGGGCTEPPPECEEDIECPEGVCVEGECVILPEEEGPADFCAGCPSEDSLVTQMFLDPDIPDKQISAVIFAEEGTKRLAIEDGTVFAQVIANDLSSTTVCKMATDENGEVTFDYSENEVCKETGCIINLVFCCANIGDVCLLPLCLSDETITSQSMIPACDSASAPSPWPLQSRVIDAADEASPLYPVFDDISIPPEPKLIGLGFTFELCFPVLVIFGLLSAAMFSVGRNPFQMFSLYTPRFKRVQQRAIRARGFTLNFNAIASAIAGAAQGQGGLKKKDGKWTSGRKSRKEKKAARRSAMKDIKKIRTAVKRARSGKGFTSAQVSKGGGKGGGNDVAERVGVQGDLGQLAEGGPGSTLRWMAETGVGTSSKLTARALGATLGNALLARILGRYAFTSWIVYGGGRTETVTLKDGSTVERPKGFRGLRRIIDGALKVSAAGYVVNNCKNARDNISWNEKKGPDGAVTVTYYNEKHDKVTRTFDDDKEGRKELVELRGKIIMPTLMVLNNAADLRAKYLAKDGSELVEAMGEVRDAANKRLGFTSGEGKKAKKLNLSVDEARAEGKKKYAAQFEGDEEIAAMLPDSRGVRRGREKISDNRKLTAYVDGFEKKADALGTKEADRKNKVMSVKEMSFAAAVLEEAESRYGADVVANDATLSKLAKALGNASEASVWNFRFQPQVGEMTAFRNYSRALVASVAIEGGNTELMASHVDSLSFSNKLATDEGGVPARSDLLLAAAILKKADKEMGTLGTPGAEVAMKSEELAGLANALVEGSKIHAQNAPPEYKAQALQLQIYSASLVGNIAAEGEHPAMADPNLADTSIRSLAEGAEASKEYLKQNAPEDLRGATNSQKQLANMLSEFREADPSEYVSSKDAYELSRDKIMEQSQEISVYGAKDDGSQEYTMQKQGYYAAAAGEVYGQEKREEYLPKAVKDNLSGDEFESYKNKAAYTLMASGGGAPPDSDEAKKAQDAAAQYQTRAAADLYPTKEQLTPQEQAKVQARAGELMREGFLDGEGESYGIDRDMLETQAAQEFMQDGTRNANMRRQMNSAVDALIMQDIQSGRFKPSDETRRTEEMGEAQMDAKAEARKAQADSFMGRWKAGMPLYGDGSPSDTDAARAQKIADTARRNFDRNNFAPSAPAATIASPTSTPEEKSAARQELANAMENQYLDRTIPVDSKPLSTGESLPRVSDVRYEAQRKYGPSAPQELIDAHVVGKYNSLSESLSGQAPGGVPLTSDQQEARQAAARRAGEIADDYQNQVGAARDLAEQSRLQSAEMSPDPAGATMNFVQEDYAANQEDYLKLSNPNRREESKIGFNNGDFNALDSAVSGIQAGEPPGMGEISRREAREYGISREAHADQSFRVGVERGIEGYKERERRIEEWEKAAAAPKVEPPPQPEIKPESPKPAETPKPQEIPKQPEYKEQPKPPEPAEIKPDYSAEPPREPEKAPEPPKVEPPPKPQKLPKQPKHKEPETPVMDFTQPEQPKPRKQPKRQKPPKSTLPAGTKEIKPEAPKQDYSDSIAKREEKARRLREFAKRLRKKKGDETA